MKIHLECMERVYTTSFQVKIRQEDMSPMRGHKKNAVRILMSGARAAVVAFFILGMTVPFMSCADLREEFNPSQWRYSPVPDAAPSWEEDYGLPDDISGEEPFQ
jgi:hypothetical protein